MRGERVALVRWERCCGRVEQALPPSLPGQTVTDAAPTLPSLVVTFWSRPGTILHGLPSRSSLLRNLDLTATTRRTRQARQPPKIDRPPRRRAVAQPVRRLLPSIAATLRLLPAAVPHRAALSGCQQQCQLWLS